MLMEDIRRPEGVKDIKEGGAQKSWEKMESRDRWRFISALC